MALDTETRDQLISTIRRCVDEQLIPAEAQVAQTDAIPGDVLAEMKDIGLFGLSISEEYGGNGCIAAYRAEQLYHDARLFRIYAGTTQIQQGIIARAMAEQARAAM